MRLVALAAALFLCCGPKLDPVPLPAPCTVNCQPERPDGCTRSTCAGLQRNCGQLPDGCGGTLECGACAAGLTCGGGGAANLCGAPACVAETSAAFCARLGKDCDEITFADNCGVPRQVNCGACTSPATCGGGKVANVCGNGCAPESSEAFCARLGRCHVVTAADNCGVQRTATCGCSAPLLCEGKANADLCECGALLHACSADAECCSRSCRNALCCGGPGELCNDDPECCVGSCSGGKCCRPTGATCTGLGDCCSNACTGGKCG